MSANAQQLAEVIPLPLREDTAAGEAEGFWAVIDLDDLESLDIGEGASASLIYVEGDLALYLDEEDTEDALQHVSDRDMVIMRALLDLANSRLTREARRRRLQPAA